MFRYPASLRLSQTYSCRQTLRGLESGLRPGHVQTDCLSQPLFHSEQHERRTQFHSEQHERRCMLSNHGGGAAVLSSCGFRLLSNGFLLWLSLDWGIAIREHRDSHGRTVWRLNRWRRCSRNFNNSVCSW